MLRSFACLLSVLAVPILEGCTDDAYAIAGGAPDASLPSYDASISDSGAPPSVDALAEGAASNDAAADALYCPQCCTQCLERLASVFVGDMVLDSTSLYASLGATIMKIGLDGGAQTTLASSQSSNEIVVDSTNVYWGNQGLCLLDGGTVTCSAGVVRVPIAGGTPITLATDTAPVFGIAVDATSVYYADQNNEIMSVPIDGGTPKLLTTTSDVVFDLQAGPGAVYWTYPGTPCDAGVCSGSVMAVPLDGGAPTTLASGQGSPGIFAVDSTNVYWAATSGDNSEAFAVMSVPAGGGTPVTLAVGSGDLFGLTWDGTSFYWLTGDGRVMTMLRDGGAETTLAVGQYSPRDILVSPTSLYWADYPSVAYEADSGAIMKLTPK
jgi:hypothetical protein